MEKTLGCQLFDRLGRSIKPTGKADILYPRALSIIADINKAKDEISLADKDVSGELVIGASTIPGAYILPNIASIFKKQYPETSFEIRISDSEKVIDSVINHEFLIGIVGTKTVNKNLTFLPFIEDELVLAGAADIKINDISLQKLFLLPFLSREKGSGTRRSMEEFWLRNKIAGELNTVAVFGSNVAIKEAVKANLGVSILSRISISDELKYGKIKEIKMDGVNMKRSFYIVYLKNRTLPNHYKVFLDSLRGN